MNNLEIQESLTWQNAQPLSRVFMAHTEQDMANPRIPEFVVVQSIREVFVKLDNIRAEEIAKGGLAAIIRMAKPTDVERSTLDLVVIAAKGDLDKERELMTTYFDDIENNMEQVIEGNAETVAIDLRHLSELALKAVFSDLPIEA